MALSLAAGSALAGWGTDQAFFEGWWAPSVLENLWMTAGFLLPATIIVVFALLAIGRPPIGGLLQVVLGVLVFVLPLFIDAGFLPNLDHPHLGPLLMMHLAGALLVTMGIAYFKGRPKPRWLAVGLVAGLPIVVSLGCAVEPTWRISHRRDDRATGARLVEGNGVELLWAPAGPGWPEEGNETLEEAEKIVARLTEDGMSLADSPQSIWRLPTIDEVVRSLTRNGQNAGGDWSPELCQARYRVMPDKESPLWRVRSPVVEWWTSSRMPERPNGSYVISYRGKVSRHYTFLSSPSLGFRAVKPR